MPRLKPTEILLTGLLGFGLTLTAFGAASGSGAGAVAEMAGKILVALAGGWAVTSLLRLRARCRRLTDTLVGSGKANRVDPQELADAGPEFLGTAVGESVSAARRAAVDAELRAKELEIRLKISDAEREHAQAIIYSISDAVVVTDPQDDVVLANESAARAFKFDLGAAPHTPVRQLVRDPQILEHIRQMRKAGGKGGRRVIEHQLKTGDTTRTYKLTLSTVADKPEPGETLAEGEEVAGVVAVMHDVTHEREIAQLKNDFVSNVSHELRTPLASIKAYVELLIDGEAHDEKVKREFYDIIQTEANRLGRLIDNILNVSKIESGLVKIDRKPQGLADAIKDAVDVILPQAERKKIKLTQNLTPAFHQALADRDMLYQAVLNLLSNAVKYTPDGGAVTIETVVDAARRKVITRVTDTGVGIPEKDLPYIFDKFYRSDPSSRLTQGTGLGLSLVRHIVETVHRGRIFVESETGKGSCFGFELDMCE